MLSDALWRAWVGVLVSLALLGGAPYVAAQDATPEQEYSRYLTPAQKTPVSSFGDQVGLRDGSLTFRQTDVEVPGIGPTIRIVRTFSVGNGLSGRDTSGNSMGAWELALPRLKTLTMIKTNALTPDSPRGWQTGNATDARCSEFGGPGDVTRTRDRVIISPESWWAGYQLVQDSGEEETVLADGIGAALPGTVARTKSNWVISCLPSTSNGESGEAFLATAPDGTRYWLDYLVYRFARAAGGVARYNASMLVTRVQDRFGNWVTFHYTAGALDAVDASDGRHVSLVNSGGKITSITVAAASGNRTWQYQYGTNGALTSVVLPDGSSWQFALDSLAQAYGPAMASWGNCFDPVQNDGLTGTPITGSMIAPSGASATYSMRVLHVGRSFVPSSCVIPSGDVQPHALVPKDSWSYAITAKTISGFGLSTATWAYNYSPGNSSWSSACTNGCVSTVWTDVTDPDGTRNRSIYSNKYDGSENLLLRMETYAAQSGALIRASDFSYAISPHDETNSPYPWRAIGVDPMLLRNNTDSTERWTPMQSTTITQEGVIFNSAVNSYDNLARPLSVRKWSSLGYSKIDVTEYYDDTTHWVLGQVKRHYNADTNLVDTRNEYDPNTALVLQTYAFEKLKVTLTYNANGTLATSKDGNNNTTTYSNWKRGIPQTIQYADGTSVSAIINDNGWITAVTDENGYSTGYGYDAMGRVASIVYPNEPTFNYNTKTIEFRALTNSDWIPSGYQAGQWRRYEVVGNHATITYYDSLWRPTLVHNYDISNVGPTLQSTQMAYDTNGRKTFASYPVATLVPGNTGVHTAYDALDRVAQVQQDSELGTLTTTTEYLTGFQVRTTNPRGYQTTNGYQVYDQPSYDQLAWSAQPEGKTVEIGRNYFALPIWIKQRNADDSLYAIRRYVYDGYMQLCKTIEPETGSTVMDYDAAGNLAWNASGLRGGDYDNASECPNSRSAAYGSGRRVGRNYDARNRITGLWFPDGKGSQSWTYTPDGLVATSIVDNDGPSAGSVDQAYTYNRRRLLAGESMSQRGWYTWSLGYGYDANANVAANTYPDGFNTNFTNNALGQPTQVTGNGSTLASGVSYYPNGGISQFTYGNGIVHSMQQNTRQLPSRSTDAGVIDFTVGYDQNANTTTIRDVNAVQYAYSGDRDLTYDGLDRLTQGHLHWWMIQSFRYDALDNITEKDTFDGSSTRYDNYIYNSANQLTTVSSTGNYTGQSQLTYDAQGNLATKNGQGYTFDYGNRLKGVPGVSGYRYDAQGRRVLDWAPAGNIFPMYSMGGQLLFVKNERIVGQSATDYVYLAGSLLASRELSYSNGTSEFKYQHTDALGSPVAVTNQSAQVIERTNYEPYGNVIGRTNNDKPGYTGHVMDSATGLTYMQQRYYDPTIGRFLSTDPVTAYEKPGQSFNRYAYAANNPYKFTDPDGRQEAADRFNDQYKKDAESGNLAVWKPFEKPALAVGGVMLIVPAVLAAPVELTGGGLLATGKALLGAGEKKVAQEALKTTAHGAERIAGEAATRGGVLSAQEAKAVMQSGRAMTQADGAAVRIVTNEAGRSNVVISGDRGVITTFKNLSEKSLERLSKRYGWE